MLLRKLRFIRESMHVDLKAAERHRKCMRTKQSAFNTEKKGSMEGCPQLYTRIAVYHILLNEMKNRKATPSLPSPPKI